MPHASRFASLLLPSALVLMQPATLAAQAAPTARGTLTPGASVRDTLAAGASHSWQLNTDAGRFIVIEVETSTVDVLVRVLDAAGQVVREIDGPGPEGVETARWLTDEAAAWTVHVVPFEAAGAGEYEIRWEVDRVPTSVDQAVLGLDSLTSAAYALFAERTREGHELAILLWHRTVPLYRRVGDQQGESMALSNIGFLHSAVDRPDSAMIYYRQALSIQRTVGDRFGEARTLNNIGGLHNERGQPDSAFAYYTQSLSLRRETGDSMGEATMLNNIGLLHRDLGRPDSARMYFAHALPIQRAIGNRPGEAWTLTNIGSVNSILGLPDSALMYFERALLIQRAIHDRAGEAATLVNLAGVHIDLGRPDSALAYFQEALLIDRATGNRSGEATTLNGIGNVHSVLGRPDSAVAYYRTALQIHRTTGERRREGLALSNIGVAFRKMAQLDSALFYYTHAVSIRRAVGDRPGEAIGLGNIGAVYSALGHADSALGYYRRAQLLSRAVGDRSSEARWLNGIGLVEYNADRPAAALDSYQKALEILRAIREPSGESDVLTNTALVYHYSYRPPDLLRAVAYYDSATAVLSSIAERAGGDQDRLSFAEQDRGLFQTWSLAWLALSGELGSRKSALAALAAAERGRAQALLDLMSGESSTAFEPGADMAAEGERLISHVSRSGSSALYYVVTSDTLLIWLVGPRGVEVFRRNVTEQALADDVAELRRSLGADSAAVRARLALREGADLETSGDNVGIGLGFAATARRLASQLLPPDLIEKLPVGDLVIIPHASLNLVPFAVLPVDAAGEPLGVRYAVRYAPSLASLAQLAQSSDSASSEMRSNALIVGNPTMPRVRSNTGTQITLGSLPGAEAEGMWIANRVGTTLLRGGAATEAEVRQRLPAARLVHLATHGYAYSSEARARDSFVALAPTAEQDGLLTVGEVLDGVESLSAELVVLSACQTGLGDLKHAEGTVGLQRAFLAKGAKSVLVSLWSISDEATEQLMQRFYTHWLNGSSKAEALRRAQSEVRGESGSRFHDPRYWAAFQLVGER